MVKKKVKKAERQQTTPAVERHKIARHDFMRDCEAVAEAIERSRGWCGPGLQAQLVREFRHPRVSITPAATFIRNVCTVLGDATLPEAQAPAGRLFEAIMTLNAEQLATLLAAA